MRSESNSRENAAQRFIRFERHQTARFYGAGRTAGGSYRLGEESGGGVKLDVAWKGDAMVVWKGLAKIVDGKLYICVMSNGQDRPSAFTLESDKDLTIVVLHRGR